MPTFSIPPPKKKSYAYKQFISVHSFSRDFRLEFWVGLWTPNLGEWEAVGVGMAPFERALVISYSNFSSIFTRFRDIAVAAFVL